MDRSLLLEKLKSLKLENKKLIGLLRDSERLFYQKLQDTKRESHLLSAILRLTWPLVNKAKLSHNELISKVIDSPLIEEMEEALRRCKVIEGEASESAAVLEAKVMQYKKREKVMKE